MRAKHLSTATSAVLRIVVDRIPDQVIIQAIKAMINMVDGVFHIWGHLNEIDINKGRTDDKQWTHHNSDIRGECRRFFPRRQNDMARTDCYRAFTSRGFGNDASFFNGLDFRFSPDHTAISEK